jgi:hypothetical protein
MSLQQLKTEASVLSDLERRELIGYLLALGREREAGYWDKLAAKLEDGDSAHWVREEQLDRVLGLDRPEA